MVQISMAWEINVFSNDIFFLRSYVFLEKKSFLSCAREGFDFFSAAKVERACRHQTKRQNFDSQDN